MQWHNGSYTRNSYYIKPNNYVQMINQEGWMKWVRIFADEPLGLMKIQLVDAENTLATGDEITDIICEFLEPGRTMRLFQVRPTIIIEDRYTGRKEVTLANVIAGVENLIADIEMKVEHPNGSKRYGTDIQQTIEVNGITQTVGGSNRGVVSSIAIPFVDDQSELYDMFTRWGEYPSLSIKNNTLIELGNEQFEYPAGSGVLHDFNYYIGLTGRKYQLVTVSKEEVEMLKSYDLTSIGVTVGGVEMRTTKE